MKLEPSSVPSSAPRGGSTAIEQVLDLARWAPSGDNTQPWRFEVVSEREAMVHTFDTRRHCVYDLTGGPSQIAVGAMLETARIAATGLRMGASIQRLPTPSEEQLLFRLTLTDDATLRVSELAQFIRTRCTNRRPFSRTPLTDQEKTALEASVGPDYRLVWLEGSRRWDMAKLLFRSAQIRLTIPEAYAVHKEIIEWNAEFSETRIPDQAVGLDPVGLKMMRWAMQSWERARFVSTYLGGTLMPRIQLDLLPGFNCAAHVLVCASRAASGVDDYVAAGAAVQRLWLEATRSGLQHQPEMTPLIFSGYVREERPFTAVQTALRRARAVRDELAVLVGEDTASRCIWMCRVGRGAPAKARSLRRPLSELRAQ